MTQTPAIACSHSATGKRRMQGGARPSTRLVRRIRLHWPHTRITIRATATMAGVKRWSGARRTVSATFRPVIQPVLACSGLHQTDDVCVRRARANLDVVRDYIETRYPPNPGRIPRSWRGSRRRGKSRCPLRRHNIKSVPQRGSMTASTAHAVRRESDQAHKSQLASDGPVAARRWPIR